MVSVLMDHLEDVDQSIEDAEKKMAEVDEQDLHQNNDVDKVLQQKNFIQVIIRIFLINA